tara:strand:- start:1291 stop:1872 length:582 start_codon:yes stop_codon:yes gene_type:complete
MSKTLILSSTSPFRKALLSRLKISYEVASPEIDESAYDYEEPDDLVERLACDKALKVSHMYKNSLIIGCDQLAVCENKTIGKPGNRENAIESLSILSGKTINFLTALCLLNTKTKKIQKKVENFYVTFKNLEIDQIERYVDSEKPFLSSGGFVSEGLGISLVREMKGNDPSALIGLPLISLVEMLKNENIQIP